jgi:hypothetical protein
MAIDIFKAIKAAQPVSSVFQRQKPADKSVIEMLAAGAPAASVYQWPGQKEPYTQPVTRTIPAGSETTTSAVLASPAERAYAAEKSRVAQMAAQNPDLQRYEAARKTAAAQGATPEQVQSAEDIGMQIWAAKHGGLAAKVKPGQSGYDAIQRQLGAGTMGPVTDLPFAPDSLLSEGAGQSIPTYAGASDLQPVGTPVDASDFGTPQNQFQAQMFNRFLSGQAQPAVAPPPTNPQEASYAQAGALQPIDGLSLAGDYFETPAAKRRAELFETLLARANSR